MTHREQNILFTLLLILLPIGAFLAGWFSNDYVRYLRFDTANPFTLRPASATTPDDLSLFWEAWQLVENNYIGELPTQQQLSYAAIRGAMSALNDPYTVFLEPQIREQEQISLRGNFGGIGAYVQRNEAGEAILVPIPGNPAASAGVLDGDVLLAIDGQTVTAEMTAEEIANQIRGEKGTTVTLTVIHPDTTEPVDIVVTRGDILVPSVFARLLPDNPQIGYIQLSRFSGESAGEMRQSVADLQAQGIEALILDLRGNGGGLVDASVEIADQFISAGDLLYQQSRQQGERVYSATAVDILPADFPILVLVDGNTASAAEILAGALQDKERAQLIGTPTFGKGSVQLVYDLSDGSSIHVTSSRWLTPNRNAIDQQGLTPDILVEPSAEDAEHGRDTILDTAIQQLRQQLNLD